MADQLAPLAAVADSAPANAGGSGSAPENGGQNNNQQQAEQQGSAPSQAQTQTPETSEGAGSDPGGTEFGAKGREEVIKLRAENRKFREELAFQRGQLSTQQPQAPQNVQQAPLTTPNIQQYTAQDGTVDWARFEDANSRFQEAQIEARVRSAVENQLEARQFEDRQARAAEKDPEITFKVAALSDSLRRIQNGPVIAQAILKNDSGPEVAAYLHDNPGETYRISRMAPLAAAMEIGRISARISSPAPRQQQPRVSKAPEPITPGGSSVPAGSKDPFSMSMAEHAAFYNHGSRRK